MAHLTCREHGRRVVFTETALIHRNGDGSVCKEIHFPVDVIKNTNAIHMSAVKTTSNMVKVSHSFEDLRKGIQEAIHVLEKAFKPLMPLIDHVATAK
jgi:hypothetical protein